MLVIRLIGVLAVSFVLAFAPRPETEAPRVLVRCVVTKVTDGDTIKADIHLPYPTGMVLHDQDIRLQGYDAWEASKRRIAVNVTDAEVRKGKLAAAVLHDLIINAEGTYLAPVAEGQFSYGRAEGYLVLWDDGQVIEVKDWMREHGHCRPLERGAAADDSDDDWRDDVIIPAGD